VLQAAEAVLTPRGEVPPRHFGTSVGKPSVPPLIVTPLCFPSRRAGTPRSSSARQVEDLLVNLAAPSTARSTSSKPAVSPRLDWREISPLAPLEREEVGGAASGALLGIFTLRRRFGFNERIQQKLMSFCSQQTALPLIAFAAEKVPMFLSGHDSRLSCLAQHRCVVGNSSELLLMCIYTKRGEGVYANRETTASRELCSDIMLIRILAGMHGRHSVYHARAHIDRQEGDTVSGVCLPKECSFRPWPQPAGVFFSVRRGSALSDGRTWIVLRADSSASSPLLHAVGLRELKKDVWLKPTQGPAWAQLPARQTIRSRRLSRLSALAS